MQFCHALDCLLLQEILLENRTNGYTEMLKVDLSDGFYRINLNIEDIPKLGVIFPSSDPSKMLEWLFLSYFQWDGNILLHPSALLPKLQLILPTPSHPECSLPTSTAFLRSGSSQARLPSPKPSQPQLIQSQPPPANPNPSQPNANTQPDFHQSPLPPRSVPAVRSQGLAVHWRVCGRFYRSLPRN